MKAGLVVALAAAALAAGCATEKTRYGDARATEIGECGHLSPMERPMEVTGALRTLLERVRGDAVYT